MFRRVDILVSDKIFDQIKKLHKKKSPHLSFQNFLIYLLAMGTASEKQRQITKEMKMTAKHNSRQAKAIFAKLKRIKSLQIRGTI